jgi:hypothetical protein
MPNLNGKPFKSQLYREVRELRTQLWNQAKEHRGTRATLQYAQAKIEELEGKLKRIEQKQREVLAETIEDIEPDIKLRFIQSLRKKAG